MASKYDFDQIVDRSSHQSAKYDERGAKFGDPEVIPLWVADMDFLTAPPITEALAARVAKGTFGYTTKPRSFFTAFSRWQTERRNWRPDPYLMSYAPGVVPALAALIHLFSAEGDEILIQPPVYQEFEALIRAGNRRVLASPLKEEGDRYTVDWEDFSRAVKRRPALFILCSPHNPVGRVWTREELTEMARLCRDQDVRIISDEIHGDLTFRGCAQIPLASLPGAGEVITCLSATKTFNLAGLHSSAAVFQRTADRDAFDRWWRDLGLDRNNCFGLAAVEAAFAHGGEWLDQLLLYLEGNFQFIYEYCARHLPAVKPNLPEGTYLVWLDCRDLGLPGGDLGKFMATKAGLGLSEGRSFGQGGEGFMRLNAACPRTVLEQALNKLKIAVDSFLID